MPVLVNIDAYDHHLLVRAAGRSAAAKPSAGNRGECLDIALINNMPAPIAVENRNKKQALAAMQVVDTMEKEQVLRFWEKKIREHQNIASDGFASSQA